jgi:hypothetical protein
LWAELLSEQLPARSESETKRRKLVRPRGGAVEAAELRF